MGQGNHRISSSLSRALSSTAKWPDLILETLAGGGGGDLKLGCLSPAKGSSHNACPLLCIKEWKTHLPLSVYRSCPLIAQT